MDLKAYSIGMLVGMLVMVFGLACGAAVVDWPATVHSLCK